MAKRRKSLSETEVRTILAVWESVLEHTHWNYQEMNCFIGSLTIEEMQELYSKLKKWYNVDPEWEELKEYYVEVGAIASYEGI